MEGLQLAQMLADLSSLNAAEPHAASALLNANKKIDKAIEKNEKSQNQMHQQKRPTDMRRTASSSATGTSTPHGKFNYFMTPPLSRTSSMVNSTPGTPHYGSDLEDDIDRASSLMALHEIKTKLKQQDNSGLIKAREKINALAARQIARDAEARKETERNTKAKYTYPK